MTAVCLLMLQFRMFRMLKVIEHTASYGLNPEKRHAYVCVTRRTQHRPGIASNDNTMHVTAARSSADLTKRNQTPTRHTLAEGVAIDPPDDGPPRLGGAACPRWGGWCLWCYTEKAPIAWQCQGTQNTRNTCNQPNWPNRQTSQTKHQALPEGQPGRRITPINTAAVHASAQQQPTISTHTRQGHHQILSANAARCEVQEQYRWAG